MNFESLYNPVDGKIEDAPEDFENLPDASQGEMALPKSDPGFFSGMTDTWKGLPSAGIKSLAGFETTLAETNVVGAGLQMYETETGETIENPEEREKQITTRIEEEAREHRELAQREYSLDPETSGFAAQMMFGLAETLPKAVGYSVLGGPVGGAVGFGTDIGVGTYGELRDKGVDKGTASVAGLTSGALNAIGVWLPATFGKSRIQSATIGALANFGLTGAELAGVGFALASQDYDDLADQYGLNWASLATSAVFGGVFGGAMYRAPRAYKPFDDAQRKSVYDSMYEQLKAVGGKYANDEVASVQARLHASGVEIMAKRAGLSYEQTMEIAPSIVRDDGSLETSAFEQKDIALLQSKKKLEEEMVRWRGLVDSINKKPTQSVLMLEQTPAIFQFLKVGNHKVFAKPHFFEGMLGIAEHGHEGMTRSVLKKIPEKLADPVMILESTKKGNFVVVLDLMDDNGATVIVPLEYDKAIGNDYVVNFATNAYGKEVDLIPDYEWLQEQIDAGRLLYVNRIKTDHWNKQILSENEKSHRGLKLAGALPLGVPDLNGYKTTVHVESEFIKYREKRPEIYQVDGDETLGSFDSLSNEIKLTANANLSTFSHEMGHWYLDTMFKLSGRGSADLDGDVATLLREFGIKSVDDWNKLGVEGQRKYQEQFASWLEVYLSKGEAPKPTLERLFERVKEWILDVYESLGGTQKAVEGRFESEFGTKLPEMSAEVKGVMDRLFAERKAKADAPRVTPDQVAAARVVLNDYVRDERLKRILAKVDSGKKISSADRKYWASVTRALQVANQQLSEGRPVDVSAQMNDVPLDAKVMAKDQEKFVSEYEKVKPAEKTTSNEVSAVEENPVETAIADAQEALAQVRDANGNPVFNAEAIQNGTDIAKQVINAVGEIQTRIDEMRALEEGQAVQTDAIEAKREASRALLSDNGQQVMLHNISQETPNVMYEVDDGNGNVVRMTAAEVEAAQGRILEQAEVDKAAMAKATECILNNQGI